MKASTTMISTLRRWALLGCFLLVWGTYASADEYKDPDGFSLMVPDGWVALNRDAFNDVNKALPQELKDWVTKNNVDFAKISVLILRNGKEEFLENVNVIVQDVELQANEATAKQIMEVMAKQYETMGLKVTNMVGRAKKVGARDGIVLEYDTQIPGVPTPLKQRQAMIPLIGKTYIITCTAKSDTFKTHQATFNKIMASLRAPDATR